MAEPDSCQHCGRRLPEGAVFCSGCGRPVEQTTTPPQPAAQPAPAPYPQLVPLPYTPSRTSGLAVASLVLGILWLFWLGSLLALIFGYVAMDDIERSEGTVTGRGIAVAGTVLGWLGMALLALALLMQLAVPS